MTHVPKAPRCSLSRWMCLEVEKKSPARSKARFQEHKAGGAESQVQTIGDSIEGGVSRVGASQQDSVPQNVEVGGRGE